MGDVDGKITIALGVEPVDVNGTVKALSDAISKGVDDGAKLAKRELSTLEADIARTSDSTRKKMMQGYVKASDAIKFGGTGSGAVIDKSAFEPIKLSLEEVKSYITQVSSAVASEVAPEFQRLTGDMHSVSEYASEFYNRISQSVGGAENFAHIIELMKFNMKDLTGFLEEFANTFRGNVLSDLQNTPMTNPRYLLEAGPESENLDAHWAEDMQKALSEVRIESKDVLEIMAQLGSYKSQFENASLIGEIPSNVISEYQSLMAYINEITAKYQEFTGYANKFSVLPDERITTVFNVSDINEYVALVNQLNNAYKVLNSSLTAVDSTYTDLQSRTEQYLAQQAEARQKAIANFEITPEGDKIIDKEAYQNALAYKEALQQVVDKVKEVAVAEKDLQSAQQYMADSKALPGTQKYEDVKMSVDEATERLKSLRAELEKLRSQADAIKNPKKEPVIVDQEEYDRAKKLLDTLEQIKQKKAELESLKAKQSNNVATGNIQGTQEYANTAAEIHNVQSEIQSLESELGVLNEKSNQTANNMSTAYSTVANAVSRLVPGIGGQIGTIISSVGKIIENYGAVEEGAENASQAVSEGASGAASSVSSNANLIIMIISAAVAVSIGIIKKAFSTFSGWGKRFVSEVKQINDKIVAFFTSTANTIKTAFGKIGSVIGKSTKSIFKFFSQIGKGRKSHNMDFKHMLTAVLKYGFGIRSIYMAFRKLRSMVTEGFKSMAQFADRFNRAMTNITSSWNQLKGQVSAIFEPLITAFEPILTALIDKLTQAALAVTKLMGALMGFKQVLKATKVIKDYANAVGSANKQLAGFDELNNLTSDSGSGADDFGNGWEWVDAELPDWLKKVQEIFNTTQDFSEYGRKLSEAIVTALDKIEWDKIQDKAKKIGKSVATFLNGMFTDELGNVDTKMFDKIGYTISNGLNTVLYAAQSFLENFKFKRFGTALASGLKTAISTFDWSALQNTFATFGSSVADLITGAVIDGLVLEDIGTAIGNYVNSISAMFQSFISGISWLALGNEIANGILSAIRTIDWDVVLSNLVNGFTGMLTTLAQTINGLFSYVVFEDVDSGELLVNAIGIDFNSLGKNISLGFAGMLKGIGDFIANLNFDDIAVGISEFFKGFDPSLIATALAYAINQISASDVVKAVSTTLDGIVSSIFEFFTKLFETVDFGQLITSITTGFVGFIQNLSKNISGLLDTITEEIDPNQLGASIKLIIQSIIALFGQIAMDEDFWSWFDVVIQNVDLQSLADGVGGVLIELLNHLPMDEILTYLQEVFMNLFTIGANLLPKIGGAIIQGLWNGITAKVAEILHLDKLFQSSIVEPAEETLEIGSPSKLFYRIGQWLIEGLVNGIVNLLASIGKVFGSITQIISDAVSEWWLNITNKVTEIQETLATKWEEIKTNITEKWSEAKDIIFNKWEEIKTTITDSITKVKETLTTKWNEIKTVIQEKVDLIRDNLRNKWDEIKTNITNKFTEMKDTISNKLEDWKNNISDKLTNIKNLFIEKFTTIKDKVSEIVHNMWDVIKQPLNAILGGAETVANGVINGINGAINALNKLSFTVPKWVPEIGGSTFGFNLGTLSNVSLPRLAQGAVIPPNKEFMAVLGDQKHGTNIETPLETMLEAFNMALDQNSSDEQIISLMQTQIQLLQAIANKRFGHTDKEIFDSVVKTENEQYKISGKHVLAG